MTKHASPELKIGSWNVEHGHRPVREHCKMILAEFDALGLDVLALEELKDYAATLASMATFKGYELVYFHDAQADNQIGLLVRDPKEIERDWIFKPGKWATSWFTSTGQFVAGTFPVAIKIAGIVVAAVHAPVSVNWDRAGHPVGPPRRVAAYEGHSKREVRFLNHHPHVVLIGDHNAFPTDRGVYTPEWVAQQAGATVVPPDQGTGHGPIDFAIVQGVSHPGTVTVHPQAGGSFGAQKPDHYLVEFTVKRLG